ncbi:MAG: hypothetical protein PHX16_10245 [Syntrophaceticus sp.]|jgi:hypothetical protein|nr:hypothetical protein [Candidatus ainarchaeum sp.]MDD4783992.1 hypothetical protein [Syntrophaceticus sp.]
MTLLLTLFAAIICTVIWYNRAPHDNMKVGVLVFLYGGASLMWMIDAVFEYSELQAEFFTPAPVDMLNDLYLGLSTIALGLIVWLVVLFITDPKGKVRASLFKKS